jgi:hypothetical protein
MNTECRFLGLILQNQIELSITKNVSIELKSPLLTNELQD